MVFYQEYSDCDHSSFNFGKYNSWLDDITPVLQKYNPV